MMQHIDYWRVHFNKVNSFSLPVQACAPTYARSYENSLRPGFLASWERIVYRDLRRVDEMDFTFVNQFLINRAIRPNMSERAWSYTLLSPGDYPERSGYQKVWACTNRNKHSDLFYS